MTDAFASHTSSLDAPAANAALITPNDSTDLANATRAILVGTSGDLAVVTVGGQTVTIPGEALPAGQILPLRLTRVLSTGTTASDLVALW